MVIEYAFFHEAYKGKIHPSNMRFAKKEIIDILLTWIAIAIAFTIFLLRSTTGDITSMFILSIVTVGAGVIIHELAHKYVAHKYGAESEYIANKGMLLGTILVAFLGILFAAPGAVYIRGRLTKKQNGIISLAGPGSNIVLAILFLAVPGVIGLVGFQINAWLAMFNMIPFGGFDGAKVLRWNKIIFGVAAAITVLMVFFSYI